MMADSIDEMKAELEAAKYTLELQKPMGHSRAIEPEYGWVYSDVFSSSEEEFFIPYVYKHLQEKRRLTELEAFVNDFDNEAERYRKNAGLSDRQDFSMFFGRAKALRREE